MQRGRRASMKRSDRMNGNVFSLAGVIIALVCIVVGWYFSTHRHCPVCQKLARKTSPYCPYCGSSFTPSRRPFLPTSVRIQPRSRASSPPGALPQPRYGYRARVPVRAIRSRPEAEQEAWVRPLPRAVRSFQSTPSHLLVRVYCPSCHAITHRDDTFCGMCGTRLSPKSSTS